MPDILNDTNAPIRSLLDLQAVWTLVENKKPGQPGIEFVSPFERIIQMNEWLKKYRIALAI